METSYEVEIKTIDSISNENSDVEKLIDLVKSFNIKEIEPEIDDDYKSINIEGINDKYFYLATLRDIFKRFREFDDNKLIVSQGICGGDCMPNGKVYQFKGNNSGRFFSFVIEQNEQGVKGFHFCRNFAPTLNQPIQRDKEMEHWMFIRQLEIGMKMKGIK